MTAYDQPALGGVYKLSMIAREGRALEPRIKVSEQAAKTSNPGIQQVRRFSRDGRLVADAIYDEAQGCSTPTTVVDALDPTRRRVLGPHLTYEDILVPVVQKGELVAARGTLEAARARARSQLAAIDPTVRRLVHPHEYPVGLTQELYEQRVRLIERARVVREEAAE